LLQNREKIKYTLTNKCYRFHNCFDDLFIEEERNIFEKMDGDKKRRGAMLVKIY
jgi:hypothetical protein